MVAKARWGALVMSLLAAGPAAAQETTDTAQVRRLQEQVEAITRELEELRLGKEVVVQADSSISGLGPAASKVYKAPQGVSIGGYGEFLYQNFAASREDEAPSGLTDRVDALRALIYVATSSATRCCSTRRPSSSTAAPRMADRCRSSSPISTTAFVRSSGCAAAWCSRRWGSSTKFTSRRLSSAPSGRRPSG